MAYAWPGNVRELENIMHTLSIMAENDVITEDDISKYIYPIKKVHIKYKNIHQSTYKESMNRYEYLLLSRILSEAGSLKMAASILGMDRTTLFRRIKKLEQLGYTFSN